MTRPVGYNIPTYTTHQRLQPGERSISTWKTETTANGESVTITNGSDGNEKYLNQTFPIVRYEFGGTKIIFKTTGDSE